MTPPPRAILTFSLPEEQEEFELAQSAGKLHTVLWELDQYLRSEIKYKEHKGPHLRCLEELREKLHGLMAENGVKF